MITTTNIDRSLRLTFYQKDSCIISPTATFAALTPYLFALLVVVSCKSGPKLKEGVGWAGEWGGLNKREGQITKGWWQFRLSRLFSVRFYFHVRPSVYFFCHLVSQCYKALVNLLSWRIQRFCLTQRFWVPVQPNVISCKAQTAF